MCEPTTLMVATAVVSSAVSAAAAKQQAVVQGRMIRNQEAMQQQQLQQKASVEAGQTAMQGRAARAQAAVTASGQGINLGDQSFTSAMQGNSMGQSTNEGLITQNLQNQRLASAAQAQSEMNTKASAPTIGGGILESVLAGGSAAVQGMAWSGRGTPGAAAPSGGSGTGGSFVPPTTDTSTVTDTDMGTTTSWGVIDQPSSGTTTTF